MKKKDEIANPNSTLNRAGDDEMIFVLRGTDVAFAETVQAWCKLRVWHGANKREDEKIQRAIRCIGESFFLGRKDD